MLLKLNGEVINSYPFEEENGAWKVYNVRTLDPNRVVELSSRINSTDLPQILDELEKEAKKTSAKIRTPFSRHLCSVQEWIFRIFP